MIIDIINTIIEGLGNTLDEAISVLPTSPFIYVYDLDNEWLNTINYFLPIKEYIGIMESFVIAVLMYYVVRVPLRWVKAAGD